ERGRGNNGTLHIASPCLFSGQVHRRRSIGKELPCLQARHPTTEGTPALYRYSSTLASQDNAATTWRPDHEFVNRAKTSIFLALPGPHSVGPGRPSEIAAHGRAGVAGMSTGRIR